MKAGDNKEPFA